MEKRERERRRKSQHKDPPIVGERAWLILEVLGWMAPSPARVPVVALPQAGGAQEALDELEACGAVRRCGGDGTPGGAAVEVCAEAWYASRTGPARSYELAVAGLSRACDGVDFHNAETWPLAAAVVEHAEAVLAAKGVRESKVRARWGGRGRADLAWVLASYYSECAQHMESAERMWRRRIEVQEEALGAGTPESAPSLHELARVLCKSGDLQAALAMYEAAARLKEEGTTSYAITLHNMAGVLEAMGQFGRAGHLYEEDMLIGLRTLGPNHPEVATTINSMSHNLAALGQFTRAEELARQALQIRRAVYGDRHPRVASSIATVADLESARGNMEAALSLHREACDIRRATLGDSHPAVASSLHAIASQYERQGRYASALRELDEALAIKEAARGPEHGEMAPLLASRAEALGRMGLHDEALAASARAVEITERVFGAASWSAASCVCARGAVLCRAGRHAEALGAADRALATVTGMAGHDHPRVSELEADRCEALLGLGRADEAERAARAAVRVDAALDVGDDTPRAARRLHLLGAALAAVGAACGRDEAVAALGRALEIRERRLGPAHDDTTASRRALEALQER